MRKKQFSLLCVKRVATCALAATIGATSLPTSVAFAETVTENTQAVSSETTVGTKESTTLEVQEVTEETKETTVETPDNSTEAITANENTTPEEEVVASEEENKETDNVEVVENNASIKNAVEEPVTAGATSGFGETATELEAGIYLVPVAMKKEANPAENSMASLTLETTGILKVAQDGTATLQTKWKTLTIGTISANVISLGVFEGEDRTTTPIEATIDSYRTVGSDSKPEKISFKIPSTMQSAKGVYIQMVTDLEEDVFPGMKNQKAYIAIDYADAKEASISLDKSSVTIGKGKTDQLNATITESVIDSKAQFTSSDESVVTVDENGIITGVKAGKATITATANGVSATSEVTVTVSLEAGVYLVPVSLKNATNITKASMAASAIETTGILKVAEDGTKTLQTKWKTLSVMGIAGDVSELSVYQGKDYKNSSKVAATIDSNRTVGENTLPEKFSFTIPSEMNGENGVYVNMVTTVGPFDAYIAIDAETAQAVTVSLDKSLIEIAPGETETLTPNFTQNAVDTKVTFASSNTNVATVDENGKVTAVSAGTATITATANGAVASCEVKVRTTDFNLAEGLYTVESHVWHATQNKASMSDGIIKDTYLSVGKDGKVTAYVNLKALSVYGQTAWAEGLQYQSGNDYVDALVTEKDSEGHITQISFVLPENKTMSDIKLITNGRASEARLKINIDSAALQRNDKGTLIATIAKARAITNEAGQYSTSSFATLAQAITAAQAVADNALVLQDVIDAQTAAITNAINALQQSSISLDQTAATIYTRIGTTTVKLNAVVAGDNQSVTWSSSNNAVATVSADGLVTAVAQGSVTITATTNGVSASSQITVKEPTLTVASNNVTVAIGGKLNVDAVSDPVGAIEYKTSNKKVATINSKGVITGVKKGTAKITVTSNGIKQTIKVKVKAQSLSLKKSKGTVLVGQTIQIKASASPNGTVKYKTSNKKVATVNADGVITGKKAGTATIKVTLNKVTKTYQVTVKKQTLDLKKKNATVKVGKTVQIKASASPKGKITYQSSNDEIATVTSKGKVKGVKKGSAKITVTCNGVQKTFKVKVK